MWGYIKGIPQGIPELLPGWISPILVAGQDSEPPTTLTGPFQFPYVLLYQIFLQGHQLPLFSIYPTLLTHLTPLLNLSVMLPEIQ